MAAGCSGSALQPSPCEHNGHGGSPTSVAHAARPGCGQSLLSCRIPGAVCGAINCFLASGRLCRSESGAPRCLARSRANVSGVGTPLLCVYGHLELLWRHGSRHLGFANGAESHKDAPDSTKEAQPQPHRGRREKKQLMPSSREQASARGRGGQQSALVIEKVARNVVPVPAMFTHATKVKQTPPQKEALDPQSYTTGADGDQAYVVRAGARGPISPETAGTF
ncbi:hypothetical protein NDU88_005546 [Pleurodeles waltl]|uniref:Uncharacterized protein n=1 Tax=Pleurodeles waltl TaxID=8319 RepID=A0AAV7VJA5_PLEWA|nr:hypothetical protein NDU88_005546 [Pleurodeles waltl]